MKTSHIKYFAVFLLVLPHSVYAETQTSDSELLAQRGNGKVTQAEFSARADRIPANIRQATLRDTGRLRSVLNTLLLRAQLAADARAAGFDQGKIVQGRMRLAADAELAEAWMQRYVEIQPEGDYEQLAREYYELNKKDMLSPPQVDVTHILISTEDRTLDEAKERVDSVSQQLEGNPELFDELVMTYSDDASAKANQGKFYKVNKGDMVESFEEASFAMTVGSISKPVKTQYGFHIIRLDHFYAAKMLDFDDVSIQLIESARTQHEERLKQEYLSELSALDVIMSQQSLKEMVDRQLGDDYAESPDNGAE